MLKDDLIEAAVCAKRIQAELGFQQWPGWLRFCNNKQNLPNLKVICGIWNTLHTYTVILNTLPYNICVCILKILARLFAAQLFGFASHKLIAHTARTLLLSFCLAFVRARSLSLSRSFPLWLSHFDVVSSFTKLLGPLSLWRDFIKQRQLERDERFQFHSRTIKFQLRFTVCFFFVARGKLVRSGCIINQYNSNWNICKTYILYAFKHMWFMCPILSPWTLTLWLNQNICTYIYIKEKKPVHTHTQGPQYTHTLTHTSIYIAYIYNLANIASVSYHSVPELTCTQVNVEASGSKRLMTVWVLKDIFVVMKYIHNINV